MGMRLSRVSRHQKFGAWMIVFGVVASIAIGCLTGWRWEPVSFFVGAYGVLIAIAIFGWTLDNQFEIDAERLDLAKTVGFLKQIGYEVGLTANQTAALATHLGISDAQLTGRTELIVKQTTSTHARWVVIDDGTVYKVGSATGGAPQPAISIETHLAHLRRR